MLEWARNLGQRHKFINCFATTSMMMMMMRTHSITLTQRSSQIKFFSAISLYTSTPQRRPPRRRRTMRLSRLRAPQTDENHTKNNCIDQRYRPLSACMVQWLVHSSCVRAPHRTHCSLAANTHTRRVITRYIEPLIERYDRVSFTRWLALITTSYIRATIF